MAHQSVKVKFAWAVGALLLLAMLGVWFSAAPVQADTPPVVEHSVARLWDEQLLEAIRHDRPKPPTHARNLFHLSVAMWDAWAAYDATAEGYLYKTKEMAPALPPSEGGFHHPIVAVGKNPGSKMNFGQGTSPEGLSNGWKKNTDDETVDENPDDENNDEDDEVVEYIAAVEAARAEAISFAAYRLLRYRFPGTGFVDDGSGTLLPCQPGALASQLQFDALMDNLGYDKSFTSTVGDSPAAVGNRIAAAVIAYGQTDGSNEGATQCYPNNTGYTAQNLTLPFKLPGTVMFEPNHWQPLAFDLLVLQNGIVIGAADQKFVGVGWGDVKPFGLTPDDLGTPNPVDCTQDPTAQSLPYLDPGCPPQLGGVGDATVKDAMLEVLRFESQMDPNQGVFIDISPGALGNNPLGSDAGTGHVVNPTTGLPYPPNIVNRGDVFRVIAEFWADGPNSETPPGHWNTLANYVTDHPEAPPRKIGGTGPLVNSLEWDVKMYFALNGAVHDAAVAAWGTKHCYDSSRPISLIRYMCGLGQSSDVGGPSYNPDGIPLEAGLTEVIGAADVLAGGKFEAIKSYCNACSQFGCGGGSAATNIGKPCNTDADCPDDGPFDGFCESSVGKIAVRAWKGTPAIPATQLGGVAWRRCIDWIPYQKNTFVTPPFPGYTSGHSTFSRSAAEVLTRFTGSPYFPGGLGAFDALQNEFLSFEEGPTQTVELQWATYFDASDQAAISRRMGSIHPYYDDYPARMMGSQIGDKCYDRAQEFYHPAVPPAPIGNSKNKIVAEGAREGGKATVNFPHTTTESTDAAPDVAPVTVETPRPSTPQVRKEREETSTRGRVSETKKR